MIYCRSWSARCVEYFAFWSQRPIQDLNDLNDLNDLTDVDDLDRDMSYV